MCVLCFQFARPHQVRTAADTGLLSTPFTGRRGANGSLEAGSPPRSIGAATDGAPRRATQGGLTWLLVPAVRACYAPQLHACMPRRRMPPPHAAAARCMHGLPACILVRLDLYSVDLYRACCTTPTSIQRTGTTVVVGTAVEILSRGR